MDQKKDIKLYQKWDTSITEIQEYHSKILKNHLNPPVLEPESIGLTESSALLTPNQIYEQTLKQSLKNKKTEETTPKSY